LVVVLAILSGIIGVLVGGYILKLLHIPPGTLFSADSLMTDDYVTRGVTLGINASAISTAQLLMTDPRAAAFSSLPFAYVPTKR
jgi:putative effector of murein hydrolase